MALHVAEVKFHYRRKVKFCDRHRVYETFFFCIPHSKDASHIHLCTSEVSVSDFSLHLCQVCLLKAYSIKPHDTLYDRFVCSRHILSNLLISAHQRIYQYQSYFSILFKVM